MEFFNDKSRKLGLIALAFLFGSSLAAQGVAPFRIFDWHGSLLLHSLHEKRSAKNDVKEENYRESLNLSNHGFIINPKLWSFEWDGKLAFSQESYISSNATEVIRGRLTNQSLSNSFLRDSSHPFRLGYSHNSNIINLSYNGRNEFDINTYHATFDLLNIPLVSRFSAEWRDIKDKWQRGDYSNIRDQVRRNFTYSGTHEGAKYKTSVRAHVFGSDDRLSDDRTYSTYSLNYKTIRLFGDSLKNSWISDVDALHRDGRKTYSSMRLSQYMEALFFRKLDSSMRYAFKTYNSLGITSLENSASGNFDYPVTEDIHVGGGLGAAIGTSSSGQFNAGNLSGNISYSKKIPLGGMFQASFFRTLARTSRDVEVTERVIVYEEHFFLGNAPIVLNERHVNLSSIVVIDKDTKMIFEEGENKDYYIRDFGDRVEIHRNLLGRIEESSGVLVDYRYETLPSLKYNTGTQLVSGTLSFNKLNLYFRQSRHQVDILAGELEARGATLGDIDVLVTGMQVGTRGKQAGVSLTSEFKSQDATDYAYDSITFRNTLFIIPVEAITLTASVSYLNMVHKLKDYELSDFSVSTELKWRPTLDLFIASYLKLRNRDESQRSKELNYEYGVAIQRSWRIIRLKLKFDKREWELYPQQIEEKRTTIELERIF